MYTKDLLGAVLLCCSVCSVAVATPAAAQRVDGSVVWKTTPALDAKLGNCQNMTCVQAIMTKNGASKRALWFTNIISTLGENGEGYADKFVHYGPVDFVEVARPYYGMGGAVSYLFVNGGPPVVDGTDWKRLKAVNLMTNPVFRRIKAHYPKAEVWIEPEFAGHRRTPAGQTFLIKYPLLDGCHACDLLGSVRYALAFNRDGLFTGAHVDEVKVGQ